VAKEFDVSISFNKTEYLNPQLYLLFDSMKDKLPKNTIVHIVTDRDKDDKVLKWICKRIPTKIYNKEEPDLKSRCRYMFHCFSVETDKDWLLKIEADILCLRHLREFHKILEEDTDVIIQMENRRIIPDDTMETRVWRNIYRGMGVKLPEIRLPYVEGNEKGRPLFNTGVVMVQSKHLPYINKRWHDMIRIAERWIDIGIHPNEMSLTALIFGADWTFKLLNKRFNFNPIGHYRKGEFPSTELVDNCKLQSDIVLLHYHRFPWLKKLCFDNRNVLEIVDRNLEHIEEKWWDSDFKDFTESQ